MLMPKMSASWKASVPIAAVTTWPVMATSGMESMLAVVRPVRRLVAPGPDVPTATPALPVTRAYPSAMCPAPCSWRTRIERIRLSNSLS